MGSNRSRSRGAIAVALCGLLLAASCGGDDGGSGDPVGTESGTSVTPLALGGVYQLDRLVVAGAEITAHDPVEFAIDAEFGSLEITTACGVSLGSFTLDADRSAGFTVAGGSTIACSADAEEQRGQLVEALMRVDGWRSDDWPNDGSVSTTPVSHLDLVSPDGDRVSIGRAP